MDFDCSSDKIPDNYLAYLIQQQIVQNCTTKIQGNIDGQEMNEKKVSSYNFFFKMRMNVIRKVYLRGNVRDDGQKKPKNK